MDVYCSLLATDSYLPGLLCLHASLRQYTKRTLVILITPNISRVTLLHLRQLTYCVLHLVPHIGKPNLSTGSWEESQYTKLHLWTLTQYRKVFYVDADCLVVSKDIEGIFELDSQFAAAPDVFPPDCFNAGVLLVKPSLEKFVKLMTLIP